MRRLLRFRIIRYALLGLILILTMMVSAVTAMRFAIHGRELFVPKFIGMKQADAERTAQDNGLELVPDDRFYSPTVPAGSVLTQAPGPGVRVRRGTRVRISISLGTAKTEVPDLSGQSVRAAQINVQRRGLGIGDVSEVALPGTAESQVIAQSPPPTTAATSPKVNLLVASGDEAAQFLMPDFVGKDLATVQKQIDDAGFEVKVNHLKDAPPATAPPAPATQPAPKKSGTREVVVKQTPTAGHRIAAKATITLDVSAQ